MITKLLSCIFIQNRKMLPNTHTIYYCFSISNQELCLEQNPEPKTAPKLYRITRGLDVIRIGLCCPYLFTTLMTRELYCNPAE